MRYRLPPASLFVENRRRLAERLPADAFAVVHAADIPWRCADGSTRFIQNSDLFYLTGVDQEKTTLILCPGHPDPAKREVLFLRETSELIAIWEGNKLTKEAARGVSGIETVEWNDTFESYLRRFARDFRRLFLNYNEHARSESPVGVTPDDRFRADCLVRFPDHRIERLAPLLHDLRITKSEPEIELLRTACDITRRGFERILRFVEPGVHEYEIEAELAHEFFRHGSHRFAYEPIVASGPNACVLHYLQNNRICEDGELVLLDIAAEYANYNADLTRTIPVNGRFSPRQRDVYEAVLRVMRRCIDEAIRPGVHIKREFQPQVSEWIEDEIVGLGLLDRETVNRERADETLPLEKRSFRKWFMHGVSHSLGIDVHDVTPAEGRFVENMCVTVEPGIYLREEGFGVRLENDIIVRESGNLDLMADIPVEPDDIETWMTASR